MKTNVLLRIGQVAELSGLSVETIRYYEQIGLLPTPARSESKYRMYQPDILQELRFIKAAQKVGFLLPEIQELLRLKKTEDSDTCENVKQRATSKLIEIDSKISNLLILKKGLEELIETCENQGESEKCPVLKILENEEKIENVK